VLHGGELWCIMITLNGDLIRQRVHFTRQKCCKDMWSTKLGLSIALVLPIPSIFFRYITSKCSIGRGFQPPKPWGIWIQNPHRSLDPFGDCVQGFHYQWPTLKKCWNSLHLTGAFYVGNGWEWGLVLLLIVTMWGPQDSVQLAYNSNDYMIYGTQITLVFMGWI
jgi:hypothetical protein